MKLQLPKDKTLGKAMRMRLFKIDKPAIDHIADKTMHPQIAVTRLAVNAGLKVIAKQLGMKLPTDDGGGDTAKAA